MTTGNVCFLFSWRCSLSGSSVSCSKLWWSFPQFSNLCLSFDLYCFTKCAFDKQFEQYLLSETNSSFCKFFLMNFFALHKSVCGWLHNQQIICLLFYLSICLCVDFLCIVPALVLDLYRGNFCFSSCLGMLFPMWLIYFFKRLPRHVSHFISLTPPYTNKVSLVVL